VFLVLSLFKLDKIKVANWKPETRTEKDQIGYRYLRCNLGTERYDTIRYDTIVNGRSIDLIQQTMKRNRVGLRPATKRRLEC
jgi:hypothetical protein